MGKNSDVTIRRRCKQRFRLALRAARREDGVTLLELLVVLVILGLLATLVGPQVLKYLGGAKADTAAIQVKQLSGAIDLYRLDVGRYPEESDGGLDALVTRPDSAKKWMGPYVKKADQLIDPWGNRYHYRYPGEHGEYDVYTLGADNAEGGDGEDADQTSW